MSQRNTDLNDTYSEFVRFEITSVTDSDFGVSPETPIEFDYSNPSISVDTGGNFAKHEIIGGATVRQKIGDQPLQISVSGVETEETVKKLELLRNVQNATILSERFSQDAVTVHIISISTDPLEDGGAAKMTTGDLLYTYSLECVEIFAGGESPGSGTTLASGDGL